MVPLKLDLVPGKFVGEQSRIVMKMTKALAGQEMTAIE